MNRGQIYLRSLRQREIKLIMDGKLEEARHAVKKRKGCSLMVAHKFVTRAMDELESMAALVSKPELIPPGRVVLPPRTDPNLTYLSCGKKCDPNCRKNCPENLNEPEAKESFKTKAKKRKGYWGL